MMQMKIGRELRGSYDEIWYPADRMGIVIPDYKRRYGEKEEDRIAQNTALTEDLKDFLKNEGFDEGYFETDPSADCGMGLDFPVLALLVAGGLALPGAIDSTIKLVEQLRDYFEKKRKQTARQDGIPTIGMPIYDPRIMERYCHEVLIKSHLDDVEGGMEFEHVTTISTSVREGFYHYGAVYFIIFKTNAATKGGLNPWFEFRVMCTGELLDYRQLVPEEHWDTFFYFDDDRAEKLARGDS